MEKKYIEVNELLKSFTPEHPADSGNKPIKIDLRLIKRIITRQSIANVAEVKHGHWIWDINAIDWGIGAWICSECHAINSNIPQNPTCRPLVWTGSKFCPNCGADMKGGLK